MLGLTVERFVDLYIVLHGDVFRPELVSDGDVLEPAMVP